jgi:hypothetical protein
VTARAPRPARRATQGRRAALGLQALGAGKTKRGRFLTTRRSSGEGTGGGDGATEEIEAAADARCGSACRRGERCGSEGACKRATAGAIGSTL